MDGPKPWEMKRPACEKAVDEYARDGMTVGLGTGNSANYAVMRLAEMAREGADFVCVASSVKTAELAKSLGLNVADISSVSRIDVTFDGADEVDPDLNLMKGLGGALLREKIIAASTAREVIIADDIKLVGRLGEKAPVPVEVCTFGSARTAELLRKLGCEPVLRVQDGSPFVTDGGNLIYDCRFGPIGSPSELEADIDRIPGVIECGIFPGMADSVFIYHGDSDTFEELRRPQI
ncbi:MAG: ribose-5-phosphate isomerase RpiA [Candidatus Methanomethylophilus sp.]|nr:ribose-5-phosphate isomerase RpiA [Methanomethylophilus sp.]MCI2074762.1 ribose-5-phosphate isomerase RpiA [Methanomethylophilus sp.]MCI2092318.1 ribose-5-phosphate isomerase RpiA [Methanomethylophilus sp.]